MSITILAAAGNAVAAIACFRTSGRETGRGNTGAAWLFGVVGLVNLCLVAWHAYSLGAPK